MAKFKDLEWERVSDTHFKARGIAGDFNVYQSESSWSVEHIGERWDNFGTSQIAMNKANALNKWKVSVAGRKAKEWEVGSE